VVAVAVLSHFFLDWIEYPPELPVLGAGSPRLELGLWNHFEGVLAVAGLVVCMRNTGNLSRARSLGFLVLILSMMVMAFGGRLTSKEAPPLKVAAISSLITIGVISAIVYFLDPELKTPASADCRP
jgi:drug/metabolite transporter (DMT)-like permease